MGKTISEVGNVDVDKVGGLEKTLSDLKIGETMELPTTDSISAKADELSFDDLKLDDIPKFGEDVGVPSFDQKDEGDFRTGDLSFGEGNAMGIPGFGPSGTVPGFDSNGQLPGFGSDGKVPGMDNALGGMGLW